MNFTPFPILYTQRLMLRQLTNDDANQVFILRSDEGVNEFIDRKRATSLQQAKDFIAMINNNISNNVAIMWALEHKTHQQFVGTICLWNISADSKEAEIGYELLPEMQGKGYMQECIPVIIDYAFNVMNLEKIVALFHPGNFRSAKLLSRNNFIMMPAGEQDEEAKRHGMTSYMLCR